MRARRNRRARLVQAVAELILGLLDGRWHTRQSFEQSLGMCGRTIDRNIRALEAAGIPIEHEHVPSTKPGPPLLAYRVFPSWISRRRLPRGGA